MLRPVGLFDALYVSAEGQANPNPRNDGLPQSMKKSDSPGLELREFVELHTIQKPSQIRGQLKTTVKFNDVVFSEEILIFQVYFGLIFYIFFILTAKRIFSGMCMLDFFSLSKVLQN